MGELFEDLCEFDCPNCAEVVGLVFFPSHADVLKYGTNDEKASIEKSIAYSEKIQATQLISAKELPNIQGSIAFEMKEVIVDGDNWLEVYANQQLLWKEITGYEYSERFIEICKFLDQKFEGQIESIKYENSFYLLGDRLSAPDRIKECVDEITKHYNKL